MINVNEFINNAVSKNTFQDTSPSSEKYSFKRRNWRKRAYIQVTFNLEKYFPIATQEKDTKMLFDLMILIF